MKKIKMRNGLISSSRMKAGLLGLALLAVAACEQIGQSTVAGQLLQGSGLGQKAEAGSGEINIENFLSQTQGPVALLVLEKSNVTNVVIESERNGRFTTYFSPTVQSITLDQGVLTATRGLGADLLSADVSRTARLIRQRQTGSAPRSMTFLNGEGTTTTLSFNCEVLPRQQQVFESGQIKRQAQVVTESCKSDSYEFTNSYMVDGGGKILSARQWLHPLGGTVLFQFMRL